MKYEKFKITQNYENIYYFLKDQGFSESYISSLRKKPGFITVNNLTANTRSPLFPEDELCVALDIKEKSNFKTNDLPLNIIYEDEWLLLVNKPSGITSSPSRSHYDENLAGSILGYMQQKDENFVLRMTNRLDKDTAGIVIVVKDLITYSKLKNIEKTYYAICEGEISKNMTLNYPIETISNNGINQLKRIVSPLGKPAKTHITPIKNLGNSTLLEIKLENGRTHQIRVHLSHIGHPLIGDEIYGNASGLISHSALVCKKVSFVHPKTNTPLTFEIDFPEDFKKLLR